MLEGSYERFTNVTAGSAEDSMATKQSRMSGSVEQLRGGVWTKFRATDQRHHQVRKNEIHGSVYEFHRNAPSIRATTLTAPLKHEFREPYGDHMVPLKKDKTFSSRYEGPGEFGGRSEPSFPTTRPNGMFPTRSSRSLRNVGLDTTRCSRTAMRSRGNGGDIGGACQIGSLRQRLDENFFQPADQTSAPGWFFAR